MNELTASAVNAPAAKSSSVPAAEALLAESLHRNYATTDHMFGFLMGIQWWAGIVIALFISPKTWIGETSQVHMHVWAATLLGGAISAFPILLSIKYPGTIITRHVIAAAQMMWSALFIHLTGGRLETHFHVFGSLAFLACYRDWRVLITATVVVAADHLVRGIWWPQSVFGVAIESPFRWIEHAAWVVFEDIILIWSCVRGVAEARAIAERETHLAIANESLEKQNVEQQKAEAEIRNLYDDLTRAHDEVVAASQIKSQFLANMSHELRTPLNAIIGYAELLQLIAAKRKEESYTPDLQRIEKAGKHLLALINDILDISKIEAGKMRLDFEVFSPQQLVDEIREVIQPLSKENANELEIDVAETVSPVRADAMRLKQCLFNLLSNACKFTKAGRVRFSIRQERIDARDYVLFRVQDTGIGLSEEQKSRLFRPFIQADASTTRKYGGTGLGLAITRNLCEAMGGLITVDSRPGAGSTFSLQLPVHQAV